MLAPELKNQIKRLWNKFWEGGIANPLTAIEQISYLIFMRRLEDMDLVHKKAAERRNEKYISIYKGQENCRWSYWINMPAEEMLTHVRDKVFPFIKILKGEDGEFSKAMKDAVFMIPKPSLLQESVRLIDELNITQQNQDTQGDIYEYLLSELQTSGKNGQFRTPRHIIRMMVELVNPVLGDRICDPACGTGGFLINAYQHILKENTSPDVLEYDEDGVPHHLVGDKITDKKQRTFLKERALHGFDFDTTMVRIALMNAILHGIDKPDIQYKDTLSKGYEEKEKYEIVLANPPFKGNIDKGDISDRLKLKTTKTELLFLNLFEEIMVVGGKCGVIVPDGVLFGSSNAHKEARQRLVEDNELQGIIKMPSGVFKPYAGVSTAIIIFAKGGKTDKVWFYDMQADGYSLDDKRTKTPDKNDIPDIIKKWNTRDRKKTPGKGEKWFWVDAKEIKENKYDLSISRYKPVVYEEVSYDSPRAQLKRIKILNQEIIQCLSELEEII
ncbi:MAG: SAM-dependent DNA methyltransferase [Candidatus Omnitrophica bacterium]|nr:SAM-dependent DNA methyltransferase [Candidatus Omnitrophota bacterium]MDE2222629.1 SAM-dependent DNA methyltransferase [Candidatus Omnitrophota bacterium]